MTPFWPRISVITPSFNQRQFLAECIQSVLGQNYPNLEYIIIDGGSTDGSVDLIRHYQPHLAYWVSEPDAGQSEAINKGLGRATGELVAWLNSDDYYLSNALAMAAQSYRRRPEAPFYFGNGYRVNQAGQIKRPHFSRWPCRFNRPAMIFGLNYIMQPATFINRRYLNQAGLLDPRLHYGLDTDLWLRLSALAEPQPIPAMMSASREYAATKTSAGSFERVEELRRVAARYAGQPITPGVICYFLDTLYQTAGVSASYRRSILRFWADTSLLLEQYGAGPDGFPLPDNEIAAPLHRWKRRGWLYLRNWLKGHLAH